MDPCLVFDKDIIRFENTRQRSKTLEKPHLLIDLTGQISKEDQFPFATGGFADVWLGTWNTVDRSHLVSLYVLASPLLILWLTTSKVAVKVIRAFGKGDEADAKIRYVRMNLTSLLDHSLTIGIYLQRLNKELDIWKCLQHRHIIPLFGVCHDMGRYASMVSPWMRNGNAAKYFERRHDRDCFVLSSRLKLVRRIIIPVRERLLNLFKPTSCVRLQPGLNIVRCFLRHAFYISLTNVQCICSIRRLFTGTLRQYVDFGIKFAFNS